MSGKKLIQKQIFGSLALNMSRRTAFVDKFSILEGSLNCKIISKCGKKWKLKYRIVASTFNIFEQNKLKGGKNKNKTYKHQ